MLEMRQTVTHDDFGGHGDVFEALALEIADVDRAGRRRCMDIEIDQRTGSVFTWQSPD